MEGHIELPPLGQSEFTLLWAVLASAFIALAYGWYLVRSVLSEDPGTEKMQEIARAIEEGAMAYLGRQVRTMIWFVILITIGLYLMYESLPEQYPHPLPIGVAVAFLMGVMASYGAGYVGMWLAVKGNVRTANAALKGFKPALELAFRAGTVSGMFTVGFGLLGATLIFMIFREEAMKVLIGFGFGGSLAALFMRVGGGIFTKAADVGADLVGKVEHNIPEDDPRNAAVIADNVGDNVGDCAGMAADVFESYEVTLVAAIILAAVMTTAPDFKEIYGDASSAFALKLIIFPLLIRAVGVFSSIIGTWAVRAKEDGLADPMRPITIGYWTASLVSVVGFAFINYWYVLDPMTGEPDFRFFWATTMGIVLALVTLWLTNHFTHPDLRPTTETAVAARTGPATLILAGTAEGLESTVWAALTIGLTILSSLIIFPDSPALAAYGIALTGLGLLTTTGFILAMDTYGPINGQRPRYFRDVGHYRRARSQSKPRVDGRDWKHDKSADKGFGHRHRCDRCYFPVQFLHRCDGSDPNRYPDQFAGSLCGAVDRWLGSVLVFVVCHQGGRSCRFPGCRGSPPAVQRTSRYYDRRREARIRDLCLNRHFSGSEGVAGPRYSGHCDSYPGRVRSGAWRPGGLSCRVDSDGAAAGRVYVQYGRDVGQRQEEDRRRFPGW